MTSKKSLNASEYQLKDIFCDKYAFEVPLYQRPYAWTEENAKSLIEDLLTSLEDQPANLDGAAPYFLGSIVLIKDQTPQAEVVDGQQRLTTLTLVFSVLRHFRKSILADVEAKAPFSNWILQLGNPDLGTEDRPRLVLRKEDQEFFYTYLQQDGRVEELLALSGVPSESQQKLINNTKAIYDAINNLDAHTLQRLCVYILNHCYMVVVTTPDIDSAFRIFTVMNDRGLDLTTTDILKSTIIGEIPKDKQNRYFDKWVFYEEKLGRDSFNELFAHIRTIELRNKLAGSVLSEYKKHIRPMDKPQQFIDDKLVPYAEAYSKILFNDMGFESVSHHVRWLAKIDNFDWIPSAIYYLRLRSDEQSLNKFFRLLERLASIMMLLRYGITDRINRYKAVLSDIDNGMVFEATSSIQLTSIEKEEAIKTLSGDVYLIAKTRSHVLQRVDQTLHDGTAYYDVSRVTIEHVMPQNPPADSEWRRLCPNRDEYEQLVHTLGNLVLLSRSKNSAASNFDFLKKKAEYFFKKGTATPFVLTAEVRAIDRWTPDIIRERTARFVNSLAREWDLRP